VTTTQARMYQRRRTAAQWTSENPVLADGEFGVERDTGIVKVGNGSTAWTSLAAINNVAELIADDPTEISLATVGNDTTIGLEDSIARNPWTCVVGQYYWSHDGTSSGQALTLNSIQYRPAWLPAGTMDRIGVDVSTIGTAGAIIRCGLYNDNGGVPGGLIAEATTGADTYPFDATATGVKNAVINAAIPINGIYWFAVVAQVAASSIQGGPSWNTWRTSLGTTAIGGTTTPVGELQNSVTGALPSTATPGTTSSQVRIRCHFRYSA